jgi:DNA polymerase-4
VQRGRRRHSIGAQRALGRTSSSAGDLDTIVVALVDRLGRRLRAAQRLCRTVVLRLRFADFSRATRSRTLSQATAQTQTILATARALLRMAMPTIAKHGLTLVGVALTNLQDNGAIQLALPFASLRADTLDDTLDHVRDRFGAGAITRAVLLGRDQGPVVPLLPD